MRRALITTAAALIALASTGATAGAKDKQHRVKAKASPVSAPAPGLDGKALFHEKCAMCHGPNGMGTGLLSRRVKPALLEERTDLASDYVLQAARTGIGNMPAIPRGEASDAQLNAIAGYLTDPKRVKALGQAAKDAAKAQREADKVDAGRVEQR